MWSFKKKQPVQKSFHPEYYPEVEFDIEGENVFSIEQAIKPALFGAFNNVIREEEIRTIIGFYDKKSGKAREWYLNCSNAKHNQFIARFRKKLGLENNQDKPISQLRVG